MRISYDYLKRKFDRDFLIGVHPLYFFNWNDKRYCIHADTEKCYLYYIEPHVVKREDCVDEEAYLLLSVDPYLFYGKIELSDFPSFEELVTNGCIEDQRIRDIWDALDFIDLDYEFPFYYEPHDSVLIKKSSEYGVVKEVEEKDGKVFYMVDISGKPFYEDVELIPCEADDLEYDERPETIKHIKDGYANYLGRMLDQG